MTREEEGVIRGVIADAPLRLILAELRARGWVVGDKDHERSSRHPIICGWCVPELDARPAYTPERVPFDAERGG